MAAHYENEATLKTETRRCKEMEKYEIMYILTATLEEEARKNEIAKVQGILESNGFKVAEAKEWGLRDLAYPIEKQNKGFYVILTVEGESEGLNEFDRLIKLDNAVLRHLITVVED